MEEIMCDYSLETYRSRPAQLGERYETREFESLSIGFIAPGDPRTAVCMAYDTKLRLEGIPERVQRAKCVSANEDVTFIRLERGPHHEWGAFRQWFGGDAARAWYRCEGLCLQRFVVTRLVAGGCRGGVALGPAGDLSQQACRSA